MFLKLTVENFIDQMAERGYKHFLKSGYGIMKHINFNSVPMMVMEDIYSLHVNYSVTEEVEVNYLRRFDKYRSNLFSVDALKNKERFYFERSIENFFSDIYGEKNAKLLLNLPLDSFLEQCQRKQYSELSTNFWRELEGRKELYQLMRSNRTRASAVEELAFILYKVGIEKGKKSKESERINDKLLLKRLIGSVKGVGELGERYMLMLLGYDEYCKPDTHIKAFFHECIDAEDLKCIDKYSYFFDKRKYTKEKGGKNEIVYEYSINTESVQKIMEKMIKFMNEGYSGLSVRQLDYSIWSCHREKYAKQKKKPKAVLKINSSAP